jgi:hypothetical protein
VQEHRLVALPASARFDESRASTLDLNATASLLLDVLHVGTTLADNLRTQIESRNWFKVNRNPLIGPFALYKVSSALFLSRIISRRSYATKLVSLYLLLGFPPTESSLVDQVRQLLLHKIIDDLHSLLKAFLVGAGHMKVERGVLYQLDQ